MGTVTQQGSATLTTNNLIIGNSSIGASTYTVGGTGSLTVNGNMTLGAQSGATGTLSIADSSAVNVTGNTIVGDAGTGIVNQTGGTHSVSGALTLGNNGGTGT
jgi:hypothetical protein